MACFFGLRCGRRSIGRHLAGLGRNPGFAGDLGAILGERPIVGNRLRRHWLGDAFVFWRGASFGACRLVAAVAAAAPDGPTLLVVFVTVGAGVLFEERLPVGDRNLVIVRMDFGKSQEAVAIAAVIDEGRLQRGFDPRDLGKIDIAAKLSLGSGFEIEFFDAITAQHHYPGLFRVGCVDEHFVGHVKLWWA